jgi:hypothetical protein
MSRLKHEMFSRVPYVILDSDWDKFWVCFHEDLQLIKAVGKVTLFSVALLLVCWGVLDCIKWLDSKVSALVAVTATIAPA